MTPEQAELRSLVRGFLTRHAVTSREPGAFDEPLWRRFGGELGLLDLAADAGLVEIAIVAEETGRHPLALPYLSTVVSSVFAPAGDGAVVALALDGNVRADAGGRLSGTAVGVPDGDVAARAVVAAGGGLYLVGLDAVTRRSRPTLDQSRPVADLVFAATAARRLPATPDAARDLLDLALAAEALGTAAAALEASVAHLRTRHQFGAPLASFQALRHRVADLYVTLEGATSTVWYAVRAAAQERPVVAPLARLVAAEAAATITGEAIQLHGGIGFTWEHPAHRWFKRATVTRLTGGGPVAQRRRIAERAGLFDPGPDPGQTDGLRASA